MSRTLVDVINSRAKALIWSDSSAAV